MSIAYSRWAPLDIGQAAADEARNFRGMPARKSTQEEADQILKDSAAITKALVSVSEDSAVLQERLDVLGKRPKIEGEAVAAILREEVTAAKSQTDRLKAETDRLRAEHDRLRQRSDELRARRSEDEPGFSGWLARRHWAWGVLAGLVIPSVCVVSLASNGITGGGARLKYFEVAAQVIPVLVLAVALEGRLFDAWASRFPRAFKSYNVVNLLWLAAGEAAAFFVLANARATELAFGLTTAALYSAGSMLLVIAVVGRTTVEE